MYKETKHIIGSTRYTIIDTDFSAELDVGEECIPETAAFVYWNKFVELYEKRGTSIAHNLFLALKDHDWMQMDSYTQKQLKLLFENSEKLTQYRNDIERLMLLV